MKLLALEAGGPVLSAALFEDAVPVASAWVRAPQRPTEQLAPLVEALLRGQGWKPAQLGALACGRGPGSFTGLRSSLAFGRGWALAVEGLKLVAVSTLQAWAEAFCPLKAERALVLLDGRRSQVYRALLRREAGAWVDMRKPALLDLSEALEARAGDPESALITDLASLEGAATVDLDCAALGLAVGRLACRSLALGLPELPWEPDYLRRSEAELLWERLHPSPGSAGLKGA